MAKSWAKSRFNVPLIVLLCSIAALNYCDRTAVTAVFPLLRKDFGMSDVEVAEVGSFFLWTYALCSPLMGWLADRYSRRRMILMSLTAWSATCLWAGLAHSSGEFLATRVALGIAESAYIPAAVGLLAERHAPQQQGTAISFHTAALGVGAIVGSTFAGYVGEHFGWRPAFLLLAAGGLLLAAIAFPMLRERGGAQARRTQAGVTILDGLRHIARIPSYWVLMALSMLASVSVWMFMNWLPLYLKETFSLSLAVAGFSGAMLLNLPGTFGVVLGGVLSDVMASRQGARRMSLQSICYLVSAPLFLIFLAKPILWVTFSVVFGFSLLRAVAMASETPILCELVEPPFRSMAVSVMQTANCVAGGAGILGAGLLKAHYGLHGAFASMSILTLGVAGLAWGGYRTMLTRERRHSARKRDVQNCNELPG